MARARPKIDRGLNPARTGEGIRKVRLVGYEDIAAPGSGTITVPADSVALIYLWGAGGTGRAADTGTCVGGGGGAALKRRVSVRAGQTMAYTVGAGPAGSLGGIARDGVDGGDTTLVLPSGEVLVAGGGKAGTSNAASGQGGVAVGGDVNRKGGKGGANAAGESTVEGGAGGTGDSSGGGGGGSAGFAEVPYKANGVAGNAGSWAAPDPGGGAPGSAVIALSSYRAGHGRLKILFLRG